MVMSAISVGPTALALASSPAKPGENVTGFWLEGKYSLLASGWNCSRMDGHIVRDHRVVQLGAELEEFRRYYFPPNDG